MRLRQSIRWYISRHISAIRLRLHKKATPLALDFMETNLAANALIAIALLGCVIVFARDKGMITGAIWSVVVIAGFALLIYLWQLLWIVPVNEISELEEKNISLEGCLVDQRNAREYALSEIASLKSELQLLKLENERLSNFKENTEKKDRRAEAQAALRLLNVKMKQCDRYIQEIEIDPSLRIGSDYLITTDLTDIGADWLNEAVSGIEHKNFESERILNDVQYITLLDNDPHEFTSPQAKQKYYLKIAHYKELKSYFQTVKGHIEREYR